ncbi:MAG: tRNA glutamyl-Q(34) synthetase GluQRS [Planctomycetota bacterium]|nr:MAG: tRNA glutamyl-Q(34) synthetase GluQRS [Planctomycetota bacterium]
MRRRGRLAPSPTGVLHLGNARTFLLAWLDARARGAAVLLRIEDLDGPRVRRGAAEDAIAGLRWLGLDWDEGPVYQSTRLERYARALQRLVGAGLAYPCTCTRKDVELAASAPHAGEEGPIYPGTCRGRSRDAAEALAAGARGPAWRFAVPPEARVRFHDRFRGPGTVAVARELGDFVVWKSSGEPAYQLAVVVDDAEMGISDVLRGDDLWPSAARQILLFDALGWRAPEYAHVPLVVGEDGRRLAKRHGDTTLRRFRLASWSSEDLVGFLAWSCGLAPAGARRTPERLLHDFDLSRLPPAPFVWREAMLVRP